MIYDLSRQPQPIAKGTPPIGILLQRAAVNTKPVSNIPPIVHEVLRSPGQPLDAATRSFFEPHFGYDFSEVRVHADAQAAESARAVNAQGYAVGQDIVFGVGQYTPGTQQGQQLLAHELTHVVQQKLLESAQQRSHSEVPEAEAASSTNRLRSGVPLTVLQSARPGLLQRQPLPFSLPAQTMADAGRLQQLRQLLDQITSETNRSITLRSELEALPPASSIDRYQLENRLNQSREALIRLLEQRITLLRTEIASLRTRIGPNPSSSAEHPEMSELGYELNGREAELRQHEQQLRPLRLWQTRREIGAIQSQIEQIDRDILALPPLNPEAPTSDINDPRAREMINRRARLEERQRRLAASMTASAQRYRQGDPRWSSRRYGTSPNCTNIAQAGCGPTSLAILLNYLFQEDPELAGSGDLEIVRPPETAAYAATHGRICNSGTAGDTMVTNVHTQWPGFHGTRISLDQAVTHLRSGNLVIFLCKNCTGQNSAGQDKSYGGHFMVLNGVNDDASQFNVIDPAGRNIVRISRNELNTHTNGFWTVVRK